MESRLGSSGGGRGRGGGRGGTRLNTDSTTDKRKALSAKAPAFGSHYGKSRPGEPLKPQNSSNASSLSQAGKTKGKEDSIAPIPSRLDDAREQTTFTAAKATREKERAIAISQGLIPDPSKAMRLDQAITFFGTCPSMCPEFERAEREFQNNIERWERFPGSHRADPARTVKAFHRPAAGHEQPLPSDVRPPQVLDMTLRYLIYDLLALDPELEESHPFIRDRTRSIRQDLTLQNLRGQEAVDLHEKIARYHIICLHALSEKKDWSEQQEMEQLRKVLQSLTEFYDDLHAQDVVCHNEPEFRAYYILAHSADTDILRQIELLPLAIFDDARVQLALEFHNLMQSSTKPPKHGQPSNTESCQNFFTRFFTRVASPSTSYLLACLLHTHFASVRENALRALRKAFVSQHRALAIDVLTRMLGCDDIYETASICASYGIEVEYTGNVYQDRGVPVAANLHRQSAFTVPANHVRAKKSHALVDSKRGSSSIQEIIFASATGTGLGKTLVDLQQPAIGNQSVQKATTPFVKSAARTLSAPSLPDGPLSALQWPSTKTAQKKQTPSPLPSTSMASPYSSAPKTAPGTRSAFSFPSTASMPTPLATAKTEARRPDQAPRLAETPAKSSQEVSSYGHKAVVKDLTQSLHDTAQHLLKDALQSYMAQICQSAFEKAQGDYARQEHQRSVALAKEKSRAEAERARRQEAIMFENMKKAASVYETKLTEFAWTSWKAALHGRQEARTKSTLQVNAYQNELESMVQDTSLFSLEDSAMQTDTQPLVQKRDLDPALETEISSAISQHGSLWRLGTFADLIEEQVRKAEASHAWLSRSKVILTSHDSGSVCSQWLATKLDIDGVAPRKRCSTEDPGRVLMLAWAGQVLDQLLPVPLIIMDHGYRDLDDPLALQQQWLSIVKSEASQTLKPAVMIVTWSVQSDHAVTALKKNMDMTRLSAVEIYRPSEEDPEAAFAKVLRSLWSSIPFPGTITDQDFHGLSAELVQETRLAVVRCQDLVQASGGKSSLAVLPLLSAIRDLLVGLARALAFVIHPEAAASSDWIREVSISSDVDDLAESVKEFVGQFSRLGSLDVSDLSKLIREQAGINPTVLAAELGTKMAEKMWERHQTVSKRDRVWLPFLTTELYQPRASMQKAIQKTIRTVERTLYGLRVETDEAGRRAPLPPKVPRAPVEEVVHSPKRGPTAPQNISPKRKPINLKKNSLADLRDLMKDVRQNLEL